jgi:pimeloyl-ACP methyl ester carboxylesterase
MPVLKRGSVTIHYEVRGSGHPLLLLAPGGMRSAAAFWAQQPSKPRPPWIDPLEDLSDRFQVIAMDQRNAGLSTAPITSDDGWHVYLEDQLALMNPPWLEALPRDGGVHRLLLRARTLSSCTRSCNRGRAPESDWPYRGQPAKVV